MPFANSSITDVIATTIQSRTRELADNVTNNNAFLRRLKARGNVKTFSGGNVILQEIMYVDSTIINANSYSGYEVLNITPNSPISAAQFSITQYAAAITISGLEMLQNAGREALIDLLEGRQMIAEAQLANRIDFDLYQDGTGNSSKNLTGLGALLTTTPTTGTYGGINRANFAFWRPVSYSGVTNGGATVSAANIQQYMTALAVQLVRGRNKPDLYIADNNYYQFYVNSLQSIQRISSNTGEGAAGSGFGPELKFYGGGFNADVVLGGGINQAVNTPGFGYSTAQTGGATANQMQVLNTEYMFFRPHRDRNFVPIGGERQAVNQDAIVKLIGWAGNLTCSGQEFQGLLSA